MRSAARSAETRDDRRTNDSRTAADMNTFLRRWLEAYPHFQGNDFFVSGESYAGVYVPLVTQVGRALAGARCSTCMLLRRPPRRTIRRRSCGGRRLPVVAVTPLHPRLRIRMHRVSGQAERAPCISASVPRWPVVAGPRPLQAVLDGNDAGEQPALRLRGYLVGNGVTDQAVDGDALVPFAAGKSLIRCARPAGLTMPRPKAWHVVAHWLQLAYLLFAS